MPKTTTQWKNLTQHQIDYVLDKMREYRKIQKTANERRKQIRRQIETDTGLTYNQIWYIEQNAKKENKNGS